MIHIRKMVHNTPIRYTRVRNDESISGALSTAVKNVTLQAE